MASSRAPVAVGPAVGLAAPLVPSHLWAPVPSPPSTSWMSVVTFPSKIVFVAPSTLTVTFVGAAVAAVCAAIPGAVLRTTGVPVGVFIELAPPSARDTWLSAGGRSPGFRGSPVRAFPESVAPQWPRAAGPPGYSGGSRPALHPFSLAPPTHLGGGSSHGWPVVWGAGVASGAGGIL